MACYDVSPYTCTYDSGGVGSLPGGLDPDYSSLSTWESASDNDLSGYTDYVILDCYDSQIHNQVVTISGATNQTVEVCRVFQSSANCAVPWAMKSGTGANFIITGSQQSTSVLDIQEYYFIVRNALFSNPDGNASFTVDSIGAYTSNTFIYNCIFHECLNASSDYLGCGIGYTTSSGGVTVYGCIFSDSKWGILASSTLYAYIRNTVVINCTFVNFSRAAYYWSQSSGPPNYVQAWQRVFNCLIQGAGTEDTYLLGDYIYFDNESFNGWNVSNFTDADFASNMTEYKNSTNLLTSLDADYHPIAQMSSNSGAGDQYGKSLYSSYCVEKVGVTWPLGSSSHQQNRAVMQPCMFYYTRTAAQTPTGSISYLSGKGRKLKRFACYVGAYHVSQPRFAVYYGGNSTADPSGAVLAYDFGQFDHTSINGWYKLEIPDGSEPTIPYNAIIWYCWKCNVSTSNTFQIKYDIYKSWDLTTAVPSSAYVTVTSQVNLDPTVAWPSTIPNDSYPVTGYYVYSMYMEFLAGDEYIGLHPGMVKDFPNFLAVDGVGNARPLDYDAAWTVGAIQFVDQEAGGEDRPQIFMLS